MVTFLGYFNYWVVAALVLVGIFGIFGRPNLMRKLMAMNILQVGVIFFFITLAKKLGGTAPILLHHGENVIYENPLPHALMLTAIVVGVSTTGVALALLIRIRRRYDSLEEPEIMERMQK